MNEGKLDKKFCRKINAVCVNFRLHKKSRKDDIINPCLEEYHRLVKSGISSEEATKEIVTKCQDTLERKHEKHNKFLTLLIFAAVIAVFVFVIEFWVNMGIFTNGPINPNSFIIWDAVVVAILLVITIWSGLKHNLRSYHYVFLIIYMLLWLVMGYLFIYYFYQYSGNGCIYSRTVSVDNAFIYEFRINSEALVEGSCLKGAGGGESLISDVYYLPSIGSLVLLGLSAIMYLIEYAIQNHNYPRNNLSNILTSYGKTSKKDRGRIREEGLEYYYSLLDSGYSKKQANDDTIDRYTRELGISRKENNRFLASLIIISIYFVLILIYSLIYVFASSYTEWCGGLLGFILAITILLFIIMLAAHTNFYWYDYIFVAVMIALLILEIASIVDLPTHLDGQPGSIYYQSYFPIYNVEVVERLSEVLADDGTTIEEVFNVSNYIIPSYNMMGAIIMVVIIIPLFCVKHHRIKQ
ncbi:MAG: hypothetical protein LUD22_01185 [Coprobacillus sp.]|nr:hypothetical protein [Coprobacillus sp.]